MVHALRSRRVVTPQGVRDAVVVVDGEHIAAVHEPGDVPAGVAIADLGEVALLPGLVDTHTHINEPGRTEWEGFATATRAAAAGGFTTLVDMPLNCLPETTDVEALELKREAARAGGPGGTAQCLVDYALWGGAVDGNQHELEPLALAGVPGFKCFLIYPGCDGFTSIDRTNLELALPHIARTGLPLLVHAELAEPIDAAVKRLNEAGAEWHRYATYLASRPDEAELAAITMLLELCRRYRFRLHIVHLSTAKALPMLAAAKREGLPVTVETCPHYLHVAAEQISDGATLFKWLTATQRGEEPGRFDEAWGGIASLSTALPVLWTGCVKRGFGLESLARWSSLRPAELAGLAMEVGSIEPGKHANLVAFDADASFAVTPEALHYRHKISPYMGERLRGLVRGTWLRGERIYTNIEGVAAFADTCRGREYTISCSLT
jgi:allantoinase